MAVGFIGGMLSGLLLGIQFRTGHDVSPEGVSQTVSVAILNESGMTGFALLLGIAFTVGGVIAMATGLVSPPAHLAGFVAGFLFAFDNPLGILPALLGIGLDAWQSR